MQHTCHHRGLHAVRRGCVLRNSEKKNEKKKAIKKQFANTINSHNDLGKKSEKFSPSLSPSNPLCTLPPLPQYFSSIKIFSSTLGLTIKLSQYYSLFCITVLIIFNYYYCNYYITYFYLLSSTTSIQRCTYNTITIVISYNINHIIHSTT